MGLRIKTNVASLKTRRQIESTTQAMNDNIERLSSGQRINKAADDAAGLAVSENLRSTSRSVNQAKRNANDGVSLIQVAESSINEVSNILIRLRELSVQTASDTIGNTERSFANKEYNQLVDEIDRISNVIEFNGIKLFKGDNDEGSLETLTIHVGAGNGAIENTDTIEIDIKNMKLNPVEDLGLEKGAAIGPEDPFDQSFSRTTATEELGILDAAMNKINGMRAELGAKQSRLSSTINNLSIAFENMSASNSRIRDVDFASEIASFTQNRILQQGGVSVLSQANSMPELALSLLR